MFQDWWGVSGALPSQLYLLQRHLLVVLQHVEEHIAMARKQNLQCICRLDTGTRNLKLGNCVSMRYQLNTLGTYSDSAGYSSDSILESRVIFIVSSEYLLVPSAWPSEEPLTLVSATPRPPGTSRNCLHIINTCTYSSIDFPFPLPLPRSSHLP